MYTHLKHMYEVSGRQLPRWIEWWLAISAVICTLDVIYTSFRPHTNRGGFLETVYEPWNIYADVDYRYARWDDLVTMATGRVMTIEIIMNIVALVMARNNSRHTLLTTFTTSAFVFWKTLWYMVLYVGQPEGTEPYIDPKAHWFRVFVVFWVADGIWCVLPLAVMIKLWNRIARPEHEYALAKSSI